MKYKAWLFVVVGLMVLCTNSFAQQITIAWLPNDATDNVATYKVYYGTAPGVYGTPITVGNVTLYTITGLAPDTTYYIAVTAVNTSGMESGYSNEVFGTVAAPPAGTPSVPLNLHIVIITATTTTTAAIAWKTSVPTDGVIDYGTSETNMSIHKVVDTVLATDHIAKLTNLLKATTYYYRVTSKDANGAITTGTGMFVTK